MNPRVLFGWLLFLAVETAVQVVFKIGGAGLDDTHGLAPLLLNALSSPWVLGGFALYFAGFLVWMTILKDADMGRAFPMTSLVYICTLGAAVGLFHEVLTPVRLLGIALILSGVVLLAGDEDRVREPAPAHA